MSSIVHFIVTVCTVLFMFSYCIPRGVCCDAFQVPIGNITPEHTISVGDDLVVNCNLFENTYFSKNYSRTIYVNSSLLLFKFNKTEMKDVTIIDELTVQLRIRNASERNSGRYTCYLDVPKDHKELICAAYYTVG